MKKQGSSIQFTNPIYEEATAIRKKTIGIQPVYPLTEGITQTYLRMIERNALDMVVGKLSDILPDELRKQHELCEINYALEKIHFPEEYEEKDKARKRLVFEELLMLQLGLMQLKNSQVQVDGIVFNEKPEIARFIDQLPYRLTNAQMKVYQEIEKDMTSKKKMNPSCNRGCRIGKTIVCGSGHSAGSIGTFTGSVHGSYRKSLQSNIFRVLSQCR